MGLFIHCDAKVHLSINSVNHSRYQRHIPWG